MNILRIALCDMRRVLKDRQILFWWVAMPMGFVLLFGSLGGNPMQRQVWIPVVNRDDHELSRIFCEQLQAAGFNVDIRSATDEAYVKNWSRAIVIPAAFSADVLSGTPAGFTFLRGQGDMEQTLTAQARVLHTIVKFTGAMAAADVIRNKWNEATKEKLLAELSKPQLLSVETPSHPSLRPPPSGRAFTLPAYLIMFVLVNTLMFGGVTLVNERAQKQLIRLMASPTRAVDIFLGKILGRMLQPMLQILILLLLGNFLMHVSLGDHPLTLLPVILCFALCCGSLSVLLGSVCSTEQQISSIGLLLTMVLSALGGCWWPMELVPPFLQSIAMFTPTFWGLHGFHQVMYFGKSFPDILMDCALLLGYAAAFILIAIPLFRFERN
ncbi:MAG: ABC transporter permease [bacterium]